MRDRGLARLEAFSDGVLPIVITLLPSATVLLAEYLESSADQARTAGLAIWVAIALYYGLPRRGTEVRQD